MATNDKNQVIQNALQEEVEEETSRFIGIRLDKEIYGIPIEKTREVAKPLKITRIPGVPSHIMGLMNLHGEILCVVDVKALLNREKTQIAEESRIIVIKSRAGHVGIVCDEVINIYDILKKNIEAVLSTISSEQGLYLQGQVQIQDGLMGILDIEKLLFKQEA